MARLKEVVEQLVSVLGHETLRMKLYAFDGQRPVSYTHQLTMIGLRGCHQLRDDRGSVNHKGMIASRCEGVG